MQEVYNDKNEYIVDLFRVLRDDSAAQELIKRLQLTPFSRSEYNEAFNFEHEHDMIERARKLIIISYFGYSTDGVTSLRKTGFRSGKQGKRYQPASKDWTTHHETISHIVNRLRGVTIENLDAIECLQKYDTPNTLFYCDPPYPHITRSESRNYRFELTLDDHVELLEALKDAKGMIVLSTYENELYDKHLKGWFRTTKKAIAQAGNGKANKKVTEVLYLSPSAAKHKPQQELFQTGLSS